MSKSVFIVGFLVYSIIMLVIGYIYSKKQESGATYFLGDRKISAGLIALTFTASWFGPTGAIVSTGKAFQGGINSIWLIAGPTWIAILLITLLFAKKMRRVSEAENIYTLAEVFKLRYSNTSAVLMYICVLAYLLALSVATFLGMAKALVALTGIAWNIALLFSAGITITYVVMGGYMSVIITDAIQTVLIVVGMIIFAIMSVNRAGGFAGIRDTVGATTPGYLDLFHNFGDFLPLIIAFGFGWIASQEIFQRFASAKSEKEAFKGGIWALAINIPLYMLPIIAGLGASVWLPPLISKLGAQAPGPESMIFWAASNALGGFGVFLFVTIMASVMSSADTFINSASMTVVRDIYFGHFAKEKDVDAKQMVKISRYGTLIFCIIVLIVCFAFTSILDALFLGSDILVCGMLIPLVGAFWWKRATAFGANISVIGGVLFVLGDFILHRAGVQVPWPSYPHSLYVGVILSLALFVVGSLMTAETEESRVKPFFLKGE